MKIWTILILIAVAAAITFGQWAVVMGGDDFSYYGPQHYKVFTYGFPFRIVECAPELPIRTPSGQIPFRFFGNFTVFFFAGLITLWVIRRIRAKTHHHEDRVADTVV